MESGVDRASGQSRLGSLSALTCQNPQPTVSHHMKILVEAGLVDAEKRGKWTYYTLSARGFAVARTALSLLEAAVPVRVKEAV